MSLDAFLLSVRQCNTPAAERPRLVPFAVAGEHVGLLLPAFAARLLAFRDVFVRVGDEVHLCPSLATPDSRTAAVGRCLRSLHGEGLFTGWREELLAVSASWSSPPLFLLERAAVPSFGVRAFGVHVNCYVQLESGELEMWVARRSRTKQTWPGALDHMVAGGQPHGISPRDNVIKEAGEEASVPPELARCVPLRCTAAFRLTLSVCRLAKPAGFVSYEVMTAEGLKRDCLFCYDLLLPIAFTPSAADGEVEDFFRLPVPEVARLVSVTDEYKPNCRLVVIDWLVRHGFLTPEMPGYLPLLSALRMGEVS